MLLFITVLHYMQSMKIVVFHNTMTHYNMAVLSSGMQKFLNAFFCMKLLNLIGLKLMLNKLK